MSPCAALTIGLWLMTVGFLGATYLILRRQWVKRIPAWDFFSTFGSFVTTWLGLCALVAAIASTVSLVLGPCLA